ncbi:hypothetical protein BC940DRAFT_293567 [Gongronella butleri]|nr:hypothetical protein BC940DRAFT_293567 [Gongronella butleri]
MRFLIFGLCLLLCVLGVVQADCNCIAAEDPCPRGYNKVGANQICKDKGCSPQRSMICVGGGNGFVCNNSTHRDTYMLCKQINGFFNPVSACCLTTLGQKFIDKCLEDKGYVTSCCSC